MCFVLLWVDYLFWDLVCCLLRLFVWYFAIVLFICVLSVALRLVLVGCDYYGRLLIMLCGVWFWVLFVYWFAGVDAVLLLGDVACVW